MLFVEISFTDGRVARTVWHMWLMMIMVMVMMMIAIRRRIEYQLYVGSGCHKSLQKILITKTIRN